MKVGASSGFERVAMAALFLAAVIGCGGGEGGGDATDVSTGDVPGNDLLDVPGTDPGTDLLDVPPTDPGPADVPGGELPDVPAGTPILERPADLRYDCAVTRDATKHLPAWTQGTAVPLTTAGGDTFLVRREAEEIAPFQYGPPSLRVSPFAVDGTLGTAIEIPSNPDAELFGVAAVPAGDGFLVAWVEGGAVRTSLRDAAGGAVGAPRTLAGLTGDLQSHPVLASLAPGFALVWGGPKGAGRAVFLQRLDADGAAVGTLLELASTPEPWRDPAPTVAAGSSGWGVVWATGDWERGSMEFAVVGGDGNVLVEPKRISVSEAKVSVSGGSFGRIRSTLVPSGAGWLAAWAEHRAGPAFDSGASVTVKVARLDADGDVLEEAPVRPKVVDAEEVQPLLVPFGDVLALFWASGHVIYICGGCVPDHRIDHVLLDPATLAPVSEVVSILPADNGLLTPGGYLDLQPTVAGDDLLFTFANRFHVHEESRSAAITCTPK